jgi:hypothetical protein
MGKLRPPDPDAPFPYFQRRTHCRQGHRLWGRNVLRKRQTDGRISRVCRRCFLARTRLYQRQRRALLEEARHPRQVERN